MIWLVKHAMEEATLMAVVAMSTAKKGREQFLMNELERLQNMWAVC